MARVIQEVRRERLSGHAWRGAVLVSTGSVAIAPLRIETGAATKSRQAPAASQQGFMNHPG